MHCCATSTKDATTAACVHVQRIVTIHCARTDGDFPTTAIPLGPIEGLIAPMIPIAVSFVYPYSGSADAAQDFVAVDVLQRAVSHLLYFYPPLSGRLGLLPNGDRQIDRWDSGVDFVAATCDHTLGKLREARICGNQRRGGNAARYGDVLSMFDLPAGSNALFAPFDPAVDQIVRNPLFTLQHTRFACGSVALGVRISHALTDAQGFFLVVQHIMELYGELRSGDVSPSLEKPPHWRSYLSTFRSEATPANVAEALAYQPTSMHIAPEPLVPHESAPEEEEKHAEGAAATVDAATAAPEIVGRELYFSADQLEDLKRRATPPRGEGWVSTFEALNAFLWQSVYRARCVLSGVGSLSSASCPPATGDVTPHWPVTDFLTSINLRACFVESSGDAAAYFPVGCFAPVTKVAPAVLRDGPLCVVATAVHEMLRAPALSPVEVRRTVRWMAAQPDRTRIRGPFTPGGFMISAWNKFDLYGTSACEGTRPVLISTPFTCISLIDALGYILPYPPAFATPVGAAAAASSVVSDADSKKATSPNGVVVYLALDASLWDTLSKKDYLGDHLH